MTEQPDHGNPGGPPQPPPHQGPPPRREDGTPGLPPNAPTQVVPTGNVPPPRGPHDPPPGGPYGTQQFPPQQPGPGQYGPPPGGGPNPYGQQPPGQYGQAPPAYGQVPQGYGPPPGQYGAPPAGFGPGGFPPGPPAASGTNGFAITALIMGILGFLWLPVILAFVFGILGLKKIKESGQGGRALAIVGMVLAGLWALVIVFAVATGALTGTATGTPSAAPAPVGTPVVPVPQPPVGSTEPSASDATSVNSIELAVGECVSQMGGATDVQLSVVACTELHQGEVFAVIPVAGTAYPGDAAVSQQANDGCTAAVTGYAPSANSDPSLSISFVYPTADSWTAGSRNIRCILVSEPARTGSVRGQ